MDKFHEIRERVRTPLLGLGVVMVSVIAFIFILYGLTIIIRCFFIIGS